MEKAKNINLRFEGEYKNGKRHGQGKEYKYNKVVYEGLYINDERANNN